MNNQEASSEMSVVALHECINTNSNVFNDIAESILKRDQMRIRRRVNRHLSALKKRMKTLFIMSCSTSSSASSFSPSSSSPPPAAYVGAIFCIDSDAALNLEGNVFKDIAESVLQRHLAEMEQLNEVSETRGVLIEQKQRQVGQSDEIKRERHHRFGSSSGLFRRAKRFLTCSKVM